MPLNTKHESSKDYKPLRKSFRNINIAIFILMSALLTGGMGAFLYNTTKSLSKDYALLYSERSIGVFNSQLNREIALVAEAAQSRAVTEWFADEKNDEKREVAHEKMMSLMAVLPGGNLYFAIGESLNEYSVTKDTTLQDFQAFAVLDRNVSDDVWYFNCLEADTDYVLNVDIDKLLHRKLVWLNYKVRDRTGKIVGVLCTGLQFDRMLGDVFKKYDAASTRGLAINRQGIIQMDSSLKAMDNAIIFQDDKYIDTYFFGSSVPGIREHLDSIGQFFPVGSSARVVELPSGPYSYASIAPIESTDWTIVTYYDASSLFKAEKFLPMAALMLILFVGYAITLSRLSNKFIFEPFNLLWRSIIMVDEGKAVQLYGLERKDEFGRLARTIETMKSRLDTYNLELVSAMTQAQNANQAKTNFLASMSHEMRTPMNAIMGMSKIAMGKDDIASIHQCIGKIEIASNHLLGVINDVLDMSKIEAGKFEFHMDVCHFPKIILGVVEIVNYPIMQKNITFTLNLDPKIPQRIITDEQRLAQVITNFLSNAVKFTGENGSVTLDVCLKEDLGSQCLLAFAITDTGIGISEEQQKRLFRSFEQADNTIARKFGGTGLGLVISKSIIEMMGGTVTMKSELGKGSCFMFSLLLDVCADQADPPWEQAEAFSGVGGIGGVRLPHFPGKRILLAEDVEMNKEVLITLLEETGIAFEWAKNGEEAVALFSEKPEAFDLILMDLQMPEVDGYEATRRIRALDTLRATEIPIIAMTANVFREDVERCLAAGMDAHVGKPLNLEEIGAMLLRFLRPRNE